MIDFASPDHPTESFTPTKEAEAAIAVKAQELYKARIAPYAKNLSPTRKELILSFQQLILTIDYYSEHHEKLNPKVLDSFWKQAEKFLSSLGIPTQYQAILMEDIKQYAKVEASTREGKKLADLDIKSFYYLKSCDVRMQRHLIRYLNREIPESTGAEINRDILEEIIDDIEDLDEDQATPFNGNRLLEILKSGDAGKIEKYVSFSDSFSNAPKELLNKIKSAIEKLKSELLNKK